MELNAAPDLVKIDVEGAEVQVLRGGQRMLSAAGRPRLLVSTHGEETAAQCEEILKGYGYAVSPVLGFAQMLVASPRSSSTEGATTV